MATVVQHKNGAKFVLLGTGYGAFRATRPSLFFGNWVPTEDEGQISVVAVCDESGRIAWADSDDLTVISVDDRTPSEVLANA